MTKSFTVGSSSPTLHVEVARNGDEVGADIYQPKGDEAINNVLSQDPLPEHIDASTPTKIVELPLFSADQVGLMVLAALDTGNWKDHFPEAVKPLQKYRPLGGLPFRWPPSNSTQKSSRSSYRVPVSHREQYRNFYQKVLEEVTGLPPKTTAPFHEQVSAFMLKWNVWASEIPDQQRREEVLKWTTARMESAWRYGIDNGIIPRGGNDQAGISDSHVGALSLSTSQMAGQINNQGSSQANVVEKQRKKKRSEPDDSWLSPDGLTWTQLPKVAREKSSRVTKTEVGGSEVSTAVMKARVAAFNLSAGEKLFDSTVRQLGRGINQKDWNGAALKTQKNPRGRDLLMYALHEVQELRTEKILLQRLFRSFDKSQQRTNTMTRIEELEYRHDHFLSLAIETDKTRNQHNESKAGNDKVVEIPDFDEKSSEYPPQCGLISARAAAKAAEPGHYMDSAPADEDSVSEENVTVYPVSTFVPTPDETK